MECKCPLLLSRPGLHIELIDTLWNVNAKLIAIEGKSHRELIDTLWNVNSTRLLPLYLLLYELIDTLWNVNTHYALTLLRLLGINRYIMECKYTRDFTISHFRESN